MAQRFEATAEGLLDGYDYRVEIYDERYTNASIEGTLADERNWITWNVAEEDDDGTRPIKPHEVTLSIIDTTDVAPLRDAAEDDLRVEVYHDSLGNLAYKGFLSPNRIATTPLGPQPSVVTLQGTEGLPLLRKKTVDELPWAPNGNAPVTYMKAIRTILNELYSTSLSIEVSTTWYPAGGSLTASDLSLQARNVFPKAFREDQDEGDFITLYDALKKLLSPFDLSVQQTRRAGSIVWWIVPWDAYKSDGHIDTWTIQPGGTTTSNGDQDVVVDFDALDKSQIEGEEERPINDPGEPGRRRQAVEVTYDHPQVENLIQEGGFEDGGAEWGVFNPDVNASVLDHSTFSQTPSPTASNQKVGYMAYDSGPNNADQDDYGFVQAPIFHVRPKKRAGLRFEWSGYQHKEIRPLLQLSNGDVTFAADSVQTRAATLPGSVKLPVDPLKAPIGKGVKVPIRDAKQHVTFITLSQRAETGDEQLVGETSAEVPQGASVWQVVPTTNADERIEVDLFVPEGERETWGSHRIYIPYQDTNGDRLSNNTLTLNLGVYRITSGFGFIRWLFDDVTIQPVENGEALDETVSSASVTEIGRTDELEQEIGSGPSRNTVTRIENGFRWGIGPNPTPNFPLTELRARQRERYFRQQNDRFTVNLLVESQSPQLVGHETVKLNGDIHRVMAVESTPSDSRVQVTLLQHKDYGT